MLVALELTGSRGAWLGTAIGCLLILVMAFSWGRWLTLACLLLALLAGVFGASKIEHALSIGHQGTASKRIDIWHSSLNMIRARPIFGVGPDGFQHYYAPRNDKYSGCKPGLGYMYQHEGAPQKSRASHTRTR